MSDRAQSPLFFPSFPFKRIEKLRKNEPAKNKKIGFYFSSHRFVFAYLFLCLRCFLGSVIINHFFCLLPLPTSHFQVIIPAFILGGAANAPKGPILLSSSHFRKKKNEEEKEKTKEWKNDSKGRHCGLKYTHTETVVVGWRTIHLLLLHELTWSLFSFHNTLSSRSPLQSKNK